MPQPGNPEAPRPRRVGRPRGATLGRVLAVSLGVAAGCSEAQVIGEGQFSRAIDLASSASAPLPRLAWSPGAACPGTEGGCTSFCAGPPDSCGEDECMPLLIDSGTPLSILPDTEGGWGVSLECLEVRAAGGLLDSPDDADTLAASTAAFRFRDAPMVRAPGDDAGGWTWDAGDDLDPITVGGVIGGNILRDFATEFRHRVGETPSVAFFSNYPGSEAVLADQGRAYLRLQYPGRLLGRLLNDQCEIGPGIDCAIETFTLDSDNRDQAFETSRALLDACVAPPPCAALWDEDEESCPLSRGGPDFAACDDDLGQSATLVVATGVPGLVLFEDSATAMFGEIASLPECAAIDAESESGACMEDSTGSLSLPGWPTLESLARVRVRALGVVEGLEQASGRAPCQRLRRRLEGLQHQCEGFLYEGRPLRPSPDSDESVSDSALLMGEVAWDDEQSAPDPDAWIDTLIVPAAAAPVIALRREVTPEGAQPDGLIGGALLRQTETVLDYTESTTSPGVRVRCLDPGESCLAVPACSVDEGAATPEFEDASGGRTSCCFGLPSDLLAHVVLSGEGKPTPRIEDGCCSALSRAALADLQSPGLDLCTGVDLP
ncbi:hypothetical protein G6O69_28390 [Pseudenhygromyxa sp. WMMC2535]|uniref:hypothetical protein n=1 Tax=Pseudenhygromyxa sp. WMMC2535 TaxID=2712867 RepID=UPI00155806D5|nr:hypothetical protein [Pseudenhygromyxa sp. WMMC2535]NVB41786.1 hypothetical protein [Pseudenhygromyxa sp. WMMC2535]